jgi:hypothetical protein
MVRFPRIELQAAAFAAAALLAVPAAAQQTGDDHAIPAERPILVYGAITQNADQSTPSERPILIYGAIKDRNAAPVTEDPATLALPDMPIVYEEAPTSGPTRR